MRKRRSSLLKERGLKTLAALVTSRKPCSTTPCLSLQTCGLSQPKRASTSKSSQGCTEPLLMVSLRGRLPGSQVTMWRALRRAFQSPHIPVRTCWLVATSTSSAEQPSRSNALRALILEGVNMRCIAWRQFKSKRGSGEIAAGRKATAATICCPPKEMAFTMPPRVPEALAAPIASQAPMTNATTFQTPRQARRTPNRGISTGQWTRCLCTCLHQHSTGPLCTCLHQHSWLRALRRRQRLTRRWWHPCRRHHRHGSARLRSTPITPCPIFNSRHGTWYQSGSRCRGPQTAGANERVRNRGLQGYRAQSPRGRTLPLHVQPKLPCERYLAKCSSIRKATKKINQGHSLLDKRGTSRNTIQDGITWPWSEVAMALSVAFARVLCAPPQGQALQVTFTHHSGESPGPHRGRTPLQAASRAVRVTCCRGFAQPATARSVCAQWSG